MGMFNFVVKYAVCMFPGVCNLHKHKLFSLCPVGPFVLCSVGPNRKSAYQDAMMHSGYISAAASGRKLSQVYTPVTLVFHHCTSLVKFGIVRYFIDRVSKG